MNPIQQELIHRRLEGKVCIVTAPPVHRRATALKFTAREGAVVIVCDVKAGQVDTRGAGPAAMHAQADGYVMDVTDRAG